MIAPEPGFSVAAACRRLSARGASKPWSEATKPRKFSASTLRGSRCKRRSANAIARRQSPRRSSTPARAISRRPSSGLLANASSSRRAAIAASPRFSSIALRPITRSMCLALRDAFAPGASAAPSVAGLAASAASSARIASSYLPSSRSSSAARSRASAASGASSGTPR